MVIMNVSLFLNNWSTCNSSSYRRSFVWGEPSLVQVACIRYYLKQFHDIQTESGIIQ